MRQSPKPLARPVVLLQGCLDSGYSTAAIEEELRKVAREPKIVTIGFLDCGTFDECRRKVVAKVELEHPSRDRLRTVEVDAVGMSMGGLVARYAARPAPDLKQLRLVRLFTIATPHRGAAAAAWPTLSPLAHDMHPDSDFLRQVNQPPVASGYTIFPYVWLGDEIVGAENAAPLGMNPWWLAGPPLVSPHFGAMRDRRIIADIARRLRQERSYARWPAAPLPAAQIP